MPDRTCSIDGCTSIVIARGWCVKHYTNWRRRGDPTDSGTGPRGFTAAFIAVAVNSATDDCIEWPYHRNRSGYGQVGRKGGSRLAHRVVLEEAVGPPPFPGAEAAHTPGICHNPGCVNPRHLRWASRADNDADKAVDGTQQRGTQRWTAKLTDDQVRRIRVDPRQQSEIAADFGIAQSQVSNIKRRKTWAHLD